MFEPKWKQTFQVYLPNVITFSSLSCGLISIILAGQGSLTWAAACILLCVILDTLDGYLARRLETASQFGIQLDSLADLVNFGVAPIFLTWQLVKIQQGFIYGIVPFFMLQISAGAYRLARYNLQPVKKSSTAGSLGLTITQAGLISTLAVLSDLSYKANSLPIWTYALLSLFLSFLMASKLILQWEKPRRRTTLIYMVLGGGLLYISSFFTTVLVLYLGSLTVSIGKFLLFGFRGSPEVST